MGEWHSVFLSLNGKYTQKCWKCLLNQNGAIQVTCNEIYLYLELKQILKCEN